MRAGHDGRRPVVPELDEADLVLPHAQGLDDTVDAVARDAKDPVDHPMHESVDESVAGRGRHPGLRLRWVGPR